MKTQIKKLKSSKLFYNKWPYKVECIQPGASRIIHNGVEVCKEWCRTGKGLSFNQYGTKVTDKAQYLKFIESVESFINRSDEIQIRVEGSHFNLFCKDPTVLEEIDNSLHEWIKTIQGPTSQGELEFLLSNGHKKILCDALPYEKYKYRVFFKSNIALPNRSAFATWADNYGDKLLVSETSRRWLLGNRHWAQDPFMYVEDDKMLSMAGMYLSGYVKKVEEFIPRSSVLTA